MPSRYEPTNERRNNSGMSASMSETSLSSFGEVIAVGITTCSDNVDVGNIPVIPAGEPDSASTPGCGLRSTS
ncbi:MAG: hypothetical protein ACKPKO_55505, partial [Candidatus Fonsibacter sp.]